MTGRWQALRQALSRNPNWLYQATASVKTEGVLWKLRGHTTKSPTDKRLIKAAKRTSRVFGRSPYLVANLDATNVQDRKFIVEIEGGQGLFRSLALLRAVLRVLILVFVLWTAYAALVFRSHLAQNHHLETSVISFFFLAVYGGFHYALEREQMQTLIAYDLVSLASDLDRARLDLDNWWHKTYTIRRIETIASLIELCDRSLKIRNDRTTSLDVVTALRMKAAWVRSLKWWIIRPQPQTHHDLVVALVAAARLVAQGKIFDLPDADYLPTTASRKRRVFWVILSLVLVTAIVALAIYGGRLGNGGAAAASILQLALVAALARSGVQLSNLAQQVDIAGKLETSKK